MTKSVSGGACHRRRLPYAKGTGGAPLGRLQTPRTASARSLSGVTGGRAVRNPSAVTPTTVATSQRRQPLDLLILKLSNAVNRDKRPSRLVRIE